MIEKGSIINVSAAFLVKDRKLFILQRNDEGREPLKWELPGTSLLEDENFEEALYRSFKDELGIDIQLISEVGSIEVDTDDEVLMVTYILVQTNELDKIVLTNNHRSMKFVSYEELKNEDLCPADKKFALVYHNEIKKLID